MNTTTILSVLRQRGLRDTQSRRLVIESLAASAQPLSVGEIKATIGKRGGAINTVTIYRILETLEKHHLAHRHHRDGTFSLCTMPKSQGHHGFLRCSSCGKAEEFANPDLCRIEDAIAKNAGFKPTEHRSEIRGRCLACSAQR